MCNLCTRTVHKLSTYEVMPIFTMYMYPVCNLHMVTYVYCVTRNFFIHILNAYRIHETLLVKQKTVNSYFVLPPLFFSYLYLYTYKLQLYTLNLSFYILLTLKKDLLRDFDPRFSCRF